VGQRYAGLTIRWRIWEERQRVASPHILGRRSIELGAYRVILVIDAAGHGIETVWAAVDPYRPFVTAFETIR